MRFQNRCKKGFRNLVRFQNRCKKVAFDIDISSFPAYLAKPPNLMRARFKCGPLRCYANADGIIHKKYRESLSCLDKALAVFKEDDEMIIRILNARGNAFYYMEDYPQTVENYHQAMLIDPSKVSGRTLYNMGTAYAEMERYEDAIKCYEQAMPRGLNDEEMKLAQEQTRRCEQLRKELLRRAR